MKKLFALALLPLILMNSSLCYSDKSFDEKALNEAYKRGILKTKEQCNGNPYSEKYYDLRVQDKSYLATLQLEISQELREKTKDLIDAIDQGQQLYHNMSYPILESIADIKWQHEKNELNKDDPTLIKLLTQQKNEHAKRKLFYQKLESQIQLVQQELNFYQSEYGYLFKDEMSWKMYKILSDWYSYLSSYNAKFESNLEQATVKGIDFLKDPKNKEKEFDKVFTQLMDLTSGYQAKIQETEKRMENLYR